MAFPVQREHGLQLGLDYLRRAGVEPERRVVKASVL